MGRGYAIGLALLSFVLCGACQTSPMFRMGDESTTNVVRQLSGQPSVEAALSTQDASYYLSPEDLTDQRATLLNLLKDAENGINQTSAGLSEGARRNLDLYLSGGRGLTAVARPQVYEEARVGGTLLIVRHASPGSTASRNYEVSYRTSRAVDSMVVTATPELDRAWANLCSSARTRTRAYSTLMPSDRFVEHPLDAIRKVTHDDGWR